MTAEEMLTARLARDLDEAFPDVVRFLADDLYSGARRLLGDSHDAEEVVQEALVRAYRALSGYSVDRIRSLRLRGWAWTIAANLCRNRLRARARRPVTAIADLDPPDPGAGPEATALDSETDHRLTEALTGLPWPMRVAVVLHHVVGLTYAEISQAVDRPTGTVRSDAHRGLARLRAVYLGEEDS